MTRGRKLTKKRPRDPALPGEGAVAFAGTTAPRQSPIRVVWLAIPVVVMTLAVHWPVLSARALYLDDDQYLTENRQVQNPTWGAARQFLAELSHPSTVEGYYQPLAMISLMLDSSMGGGPENLRPYHRTSLILHGANVVLVMALIYLLFGNAVVAAVGGLLFGIHPVTAEPIAWISDRKTVLAVFFALWSLALYVGYTRRRSRLCYSAALVAYALALMSKPTSTPLPLLLLLLDFWPLGRLGRRQVLDKLPFFAVGGASAVITLLGQGNIGGVSAPADGSVPVKLCYNTVFYICKIVWPVHMSGYYAAPVPFGLSNGAVLVGVLVACVLLVAVCLSLRRTRSLFTGCAFFFLAILPTLGAIGFANVNASDKYAYLPMVGLLLPMAYGLRAGLARFGRTGRDVLAVILVVGVGVLGVATRRTLAHWQDTETLFQYAIETSSRPWQPHIGLANHLAAHGRFEEAVEHYKAGIRLEPGDFQGVSNLALALGKLGRYNEAIAYHEQAITMRPDVARLHDHLAFALSQQGELVRAVAEYEAVLRIQPDAAETRFNLASTLVRLNRVEEAIHEYDETLRADPHFFQAHINLGYLLMGQGRAAEAIEHYMAAVTLRPSDPQIRFLLAQAMEATGHRTAAINEYRNVLRIAPQHAQAQERLGALGAGG